VAGSRALLGGAISLLQINQFLAEAANFPNCLPNPGQANSSEKGTPPRFLTG